MKVSVTRRCELTLFVVNNKVNLICFDELTAVAAKHSDAPRACDGSFIVEASELAIKLR